MTRNSDPSRHALARRLNERYSLDALHGDLDFVVHELAHFAMLFGRLIRGTADLRKMQRRLDEMSVGYSQIHELRTLALQLAVQPELGIEICFRRMLDRTMTSLNYAVYDQAGGRPVIRSKAQARRVIERFKPGEKPRAAFAAMLKSEL